MTLKVGKLYSCSKYFLLLYPDKNTAAANEAHPAAVPAVPTAVPAAAAVYWSKQFGKSVGYCNPLTPLLVLNTDNHYAEVLAGDKKGWIINEGWLELKEIV
jgi:hypothetical protein